MIAAIAALPEFCIDNEIQLRIRGLWNAYGAVPFVQYFSDGVGGFASIMEGVACFAPDAHSSLEEWALFFHMHGEIRTVCCPGEVGERLAGDRWSCRRSPVLRYEGAYSSAQLAVNRQPSLPAVYELLAQCFESLPPLDVWYPDVSHRVRHGCCRLACIEQDGKVISTAMTVAEVEEHALLGQMATHPAYRRRGYAAACLNDLIYRCKGGFLYIIPANNTAEKLYQELGFVPFAHRAELTRNGL